MNSRFYRNDSVTATPQNSLTLASSISTRLRHLADRIHRLGPRPLHELLCELAGGAEVLTRSEAYAALDPQTVHALGADRLPPTIRRVK
jgi:hypothetical protein